MLVRRLKENLNVSIGTPRDREGGQISGAVLCNGVRTVGIWDCNSRTLVYV